MDDTLMRIMLQLDSNWTFLRPCRVEATFDDVRVYTDGAYILLHKPCELHGIAMRTLYRGHLPKEGTREQPARTHVGNICISSAYDSERNLFLSVEMSHAKEFIIPPNAKREYLIDHAFAADISALTVTSAFRALYITHSPCDQFRVKGTLSRLPEPHEYHLLLSSFEGMVVIPRTYNGVIIAGAQEMIANIRNPARLTATHAMQLCVHAPLNVSYACNMLTHAGFSSNSDRTLYARGAEHVIHARARTLDATLDLHTTVTESA